MRLPPVYTTRVFPSPAHGHLDNCSEGWEEPARRIGPADRERRPRRREDVGGKGSAIGSRRLIRSEERIPRLMGGGSRTWCVLGGAVLALSLGSGCATMRRAARDPDLRPCADGFALTADGWRLGVRHIRPRRPDPGRDPVVLCHGLGLNGTFWTITDDHLPGQLAARGYDVFIVDLRGSGASHRVGSVGWVNAALRQTFLVELGEG